MNKPPLPPIPKPKIWCTVIEGRHPKVKYYDNRGHAINALKYDDRRGGQLYKLIDGELKLLLDVPVFDNRLRHTKYNIDTFNQMYSAKKKFWEEALQNLPK